ncbi:uncharacterized protein [Phyllobates terribilis]|uniref:uncharacterized protein n=1 Tax=Phyllobates terribilis TaxID=111132 RepID=UPI003CCAFD17
MDNFQLRESIQTFSLNDGPRGNQGYSRVLLQLFGYTGHGKSCFINSCIYVLNEGEDFIEHAKAGETFHGGAMTTVRKSYNLTKNITIVDNRGYKKMNSFERAEIYAQLGNFIPIGEKVEWMTNFTDMMCRLEDAELNPNYSDFIVPILIYSAKCLTENEKEELKRFMDNCVKMTGVVPIVVITHKTSGDFMEAEKMFRLMGAEVVISMENYTKEDHIKTRGRTEDILTILHSALKDVKYRLGEKERNPRRDWRERKKFMLEYIHKVDLEKKENEMRAAEERRRTEQRRKEAERSKEKDRVKREDERRKEQEWRAKGEKKKSEKNDCLIS